jgi:hypothetical protein
LPPRCTPAHAHAASAWHLRQRMQPHGQSAAAPVPSLGCRGRAGAGWGHWAALRPSTAASGTSRDGQARASHSGTCWAVHRAKRTTSALHTRWGQGHARPGTLPPRGREHAAFEGSRGTRRVRRRYDRQDEQGREPRRAIVLRAFQCAEAIALVVDGHRPGPLVLVWSAAVQRSCRRLACVVGSAMGHADDAMSTCHATPVPVPLVNKAVSPTGAHFPGHSAPTLYASPRPRCASHQDHLPPLLVWTTRPRRGAQRPTPR